MTTVIHYRGPANIVTSMQSLTTRAVKITNTHIQLYSVLPGTRKERIVFQIELKDVLRVYVDDYIFYADLNKKPDHTYYYLVNDKGQYYNLNQDKWQDELSTACITHFTNALSGRDIFTNLKPNMYVGIKYIDRKSPMPDLEGEW